ncbi:MAG: PAS domain S-box protein [Candidatus Anammoximicrobium sp.]|nr:PAS domain S-box protein [Candidatus Anammoximicrobium sp.]
MPHRASSSQRRQAERISEAHFRAVADCTYDWESWHGTDGRLIWVNPGVERLTGYAVAECHAMDDYPLALVLREDRDSIAAILAAACAGSSGNDAEFRILHRDGTTKWAAISWQPMSMPQEGHLGFRTSVRDTTERRRLREQLRLHAEHLEQLVQERTARIQQLERHRRKIEKLAALGQLAAGVAHEINNPLAGLRNAFELIKADLTPQHPHFELLELIDREIERVGAIIHQMYQLYGRAPQRAREFDLAQAVRDVVDLLSRVARKRGVFLQRESADGLPRVRLPEGEVKQVLYNLVQNAIQASSAGATVRLGVAADCDEIAVRVEDQGPGIPDDVLPRIFDPFFSTKTGDVPAGMGLGLSVSRSVIEALGGRIEVVSRPSRGSTFTAVFPLAAEASPERTGDVDTAPENPDR